MSFKGKVVLVTGASSGIGAATAIKFAEEGAYVCLVGRNQEALSNVAKKCGNHLVLVSDISNDDNAKKIVNDTVKHFGQLDVLVNNAGIFQITSIIQDHVITSFDKVMGINLRAPVLITNVAVPHLIKTKGNIVNISSIGSVRIMAETAFSYFTSKAALDHFSRAIALELAPKGVRVNTVNPGPTITDIIKNTGANEAQTKAAMEAYQNMTALKRGSEPEEVADVILFLASEKSKGITGSAYFIDNGVF